MASVLGTQGTLKLTFDAIMTEKAEAIVGLVTGKTAHGLVVGYPADDYVVLQAPNSSTILEAVEGAPPTEGAGALGREVLIRYAAIATVEVKP